MTFRPYGIVITIILAASLALTARADATRRAVLYRSVDEHGDSLTLSGLLMVPRDCPPQGVILMPHYTIFSNQEAPSNQPTHDALALSERYIIIQPDYVGYGVSVERVHPYLYGELSARNTVDLYTALRPVLDSLSPRITPDSVYIVGYSQGGAAALWTLKLIEQEYAGRIHVVRCLAGGGPYDVATTYDECLLRRKYAMPMIIPMLVTGTSVAYDLELQEEEFFRPALRRAYSKWIAPKCYSPRDIYLHMLNHHISHWLTPAALDKSRPATQRLYDGLLRSSIVHYPLPGTESDSIVPTWTPRAPLYIFHSTNDDIVTIRCAEHLQRCYGDVPGITWDFGKYGTHIRASRVFVGKVKKELGI